MILGLLAAIIYATVWRREAGYAPMLPFTAPLIANLGASAGFGMGLFFPFLAFRASLSFLRFLRFRAFPRFPRFPSV